MENSIAVISFENQTGDPALDEFRKIVPSLLITSLEQTRDFYVMSTERMKDLQKQVGKGDAEFIDSDTRLRRLQQGRREVPGDRKFL